MSTIDEDGERFIQRLIEAGWSRKEAENQWLAIADEPGEDWEGQL